MDLNTDSTSNFGVGKYFIPSLLACLLMGAHHLRVGELGLVAMWMSAPFILLLKQQWTRLILILFLLVGALVWLDTLMSLRQMRIAHGMAWTRMAIIIGGVALFTAGCALSLFSQRVKAWFDTGPVWPGVAAFLITGMLLIVVQYKTDPPGILLERFIDKGGWLEGFWLAVYAGYLGTRFTDPAQSARLRPSLWIFFSIVFFFQLGLGLLWSETFLMSGKLHLPVPALIVAGPVYRGSGFFMIILFSATILIAGPAWCSWLCYVGSWDDQASRMAHQSPAALPGWRKWMRLGSLVLVLGAAFIFRLLGVSPVAAVWMAAGFGIIGVLLMLTWSRRTGSMTHCTAYCPIGLIATLLGKINPFRITIGHDCIKCGECSKACRYDALTAFNIEQKKPGGSCTLCGDCVHMCASGQIDYRLPGLSGAKARVVFMVLVASLHAVFLGVARI